ncbi:MAG TPA: phytanoyl-CoA dioxygenase family protein [Dongiaceae bacterium]|nr:phytanoyl-CoA dioxygenase family protein [Dongiaceae bacterium]
MHDRRTYLSEEQLAAFSRTGTLVIPQFYDIDEQITPIQESIYDIIGLVARRHSLPLERPVFSPDKFDAGYTDLIAIDRAIGGEIYDAIKQIPAFLRLISCQHNEDLFAQLRKGSLPGTGAASYGIRIDNPGEEEYRSHWHQEFLFQPQSMDGVVFWTSLVALTPEIGPVQICLGSHLDGLCQYTKCGNHANKPGAYKIGIVDDEIVAARYERIAPLCEPGDLIVIDFLTIHQSGFNVSDRARWSVQTRFFNFREPTGMKIGWKPSVTAGSQIEKIFSAHFVEDN